MKAKPGIEKIIKKADYLRNVKGNLKAAIRLLEDSLAGDIEDLSTPLKF